MTTTSPSGTRPEPPGRRGPSLLLVVGLPVLVVLLAIAAVVAVLAGSLLPVAFGGPVLREATAAGGSSVTVSAADARFEVGPSSDGRVHVRMDGRSFGSPRLAVRTEGGRTTVAAGCARFVWFGGCDLRLRITMPPQADLAVTGENGAIDLRRLTGRVDARTANGRIAATSMRGDLALRTTNGQVQLRDAASGSVRASTTNGAVDLAFTAPPTSVEARSTNGAVTIALPSSVAYAVTARTTNGSVDTSPLRTDPASAHRVVAETTNGSVRLQPVG